MVGNKILLLSPHTDDGELGCGGTVAKLIEQGKEVFYVAFSACEQSVLPQFPKDILITEVKAATSTLGISEDRLILKRFDVRTFNYHRQEILDILIQLREEIKPDTVLIPSLNDIHQDHKTIAEEALRAFKFINVLSYELPWNNLKFNTCAFEVLDEKHVKTKVEALKKYQSQAHRPYANEEFLRSQVRMRGVQVSRKFAEVFEVIRTVMD
ncbi:MAG: PIG-L family deacetylase [Bacteroidia bacterium]|jgi:LmbE family N-acetylglucosaminyl deacetylase|nr:PIG-L family deacetylase [Bacteroidia bacterium]